MEYGYPHIRQRIQQPEYEVVLGLESYWAASFLAEAEARGLPLPDTAWREAGTQTLVGDLCADLQSGWVGIRYLEKPVYQFPHTNVLEFFAATATLEQSFADIEQQSPAAQVIRVKQLGQGILTQLEQFIPAFGEMVVALAEKYYLAPTAHCWLRFYQASVTHWQGGEHMAWEIYESLFGSRECDEELRARAGLQVGGNYTVHQGRHQEAAEVLTASFETLQQIGDAEAAAHALWLLGLAMDRQGRFAAVADRLEKEMTTLAQDGAAAEALLRVGILFRRNGILDKAEGFLRRSLRGWERIPGRETKLSETRVALGDLLIALDRRPEALEQYTLALEELECYRQAVLERTGLDNYDIRFNLGSANLALGKFYLAEGDAGSLEQAARHAEAALAIMQAEGVIDHWGASLTLLGQVRQRQGRPDEAAELYRQALEKARDLGDRRRIFRVLLNQWRLALTRRRPVDILRTAVALTWHTLHSGLLFDRTIWHWRRGPCA